MMATLAIIAMLKYFIFTVVLVSMAAITVMVIIHVMVVMTFIAVKAKVTKLFKRTGK